MKGSVDVTTDQPSNNLKSPNRPSSRSLIRDTTTSNKTQEQAFAHLPRALFRLLALPPRLFPLILMLLFQPLSLHTRLFPHSPQTLLFHAISSMPKTRPRLLWRGPSIRQVLAKVPSKQEVLVLRHSLVKYPIDVSVNVVVLIGVRDQDRCWGYASSSIGSTKFEFSRLVNLATTFEFIVFEKAHGAGAADDVRCWIG